MDYRWTARLDKAPQDICHTALIQKNVDVLFLIFHKWHLVTPEGIRCQGSLYIPDSTRSRMDLCEDKDKDERDASDMLLCLLASKL